MAEKYWQQHESDVQRVLDLKGTVASGNRFWDPGDGVDNRHYTESVFPLIIDCKCTEKVTYRLGRGLMKDWVQKASEMGKRFILPIRFQRDETEHDDYVVLTLDDFAELLELARESERPALKTQVGLLRKSDEALLTKLAKTLGAQSGAGSKLIDLMERLEKAEVVVHG